MSTIGHCSDVTSPDQRVSSHRSVLEYRFTVLCNGTCYNQETSDYMLGRIMGGVQGSKDPPWSPERGSWTPLPKWRKQHLLCELHKITSRKYECMFLLEKKWKNSVKMFYLLSCYNASEQLSGHQISKFSWGAYTPSCIWLASLAVASGNFPVN